MNTIRLKLLLALLLIGLGVSLGADAADGPPPTGDRVLVAGATGRTGRLVVQELLAAGYRVRALVRDPAAASQVLGPAVEYAKGDVRQRQSLDLALAGVNLVVSAVGSTRKDPANAPEFVDYQGVRNLAEASAAAKVARIVLVSSAGVTHADHVLNKMFGNVLIWKAKGEEAVRRSGVPYTIIRPGGLTDKPAGERDVRFQQGDAGNGFVARGDVARVCVAALRSPGTRNRTFEVYAAGAPPGGSWDSRFAALQPDGQ